MAKLSAFGRKVLVQLSKREEKGDLVVACFCKGDPQCFVCDGKGEKPSTTVWDRVTVALMSDGRILKKIDVLFRGDTKPHSYGWKVAGKAKPGMTKEVFQAAYEKAGYAL